jgi:peptidoglycan hydrolase CwlO-like protein
MKKRFFYVAFVVFCITLTTSFVPSLATAQKATIAELQKKVERLEERVSELEKLVEELRQQNLSPIKITAPPESKKSQVKQNWRRLQEGMSMEQVEQLLGVPPNIRGGAYTTWSYEPGSVTFYHGEVTNWSEP